MFPQYIKNKLLPATKAEGELMVLCSQTRFDDVAKERIQELVRKDLDWPYLIRMSDRNRVLPLLYNALIKTCAESLPGEVRTELDNLLLELKERNRNNLEELQRVVLILKQENIQVVTFKGVAFALQVYGDLELRQSGDIDILVHRSDFLKAKKILVRNGYYEIFFGFNEIMHVQCQLEKDDKAISLDLHYGITPNYFFTNMKDIREGKKLAPKNWNSLEKDFTNWFFTLDTDYLWSRLDTLNVSGTSVPVLSADDMLVVMIINGIKDNWRVLREITDIAELLHSKHEIHWDKVMMQVKDMQCTRKFFFGLSLAYNLYNIPLPQEILDEINSSCTLKLLAAETVKRMCHDRLLGDFIEFKLISELFTMDRVVNQLRHFLYSMRRVGNKPGREHTTVADYMGFLQRIIMQSFQIFLYRIGVR